MPTMIIITFTTVVKMSLLQYLVDNKIVFEQHWK